MHEFNTIILIVSGSVLLLGCFTKALKRIGLPVPLLLLIFGMTLGPHFLDVLDARAWGDQNLILKEASRLTLAIGLMSIALRLPTTFIRTMWRETCLMLVAAMLFMWCISSILMHVFLGLSFWQALLLGAIVTPTDPVVASSIVTGPVAETKLPDRLRNLLSAESGANDGFSYAFVLLPITFSTMPAAEAGTHWFFKTLLWDIIGAVLMGALIGYVAGRLLKFAERKHSIEQPALLTFSAALALATLAAVKLTGSDGILAVFSAGIAFNFVASSGDQKKESPVVEGIDRFFTFPWFILLGIVAPWEQWLAMGWKAFIIPLCLLLFRRLPLFIFFGRRLNALPNASARWFAGWFGPIGVAAVYYSALALEKAPNGHIWPMVSLVVCASILIHGLTATPLSRLYALKTAVF